MPVNFAVKDTFLHTSCDECVFVSKDFYEQIVNNLVKIRKKGLAQNKKVLVPFPCSHK